MFAEKGEAQVKKMIGMFADRLSLMFDCLAALSKGASVTDSFAITSVRPDARGNVTRNEHSPSPM